MPKVTIDGHTIEVPEGTTILEAARKIGGDIVPPTMCYYSKLKTPVRTKMPLSAIPSARLPSL